MANRVGNFLWGNWGKPGVSFFAHELEQSPIEHMENVNVSGPTEERLVVEGFASNNRVEVLDGRLEVWYNRRVEKVMKIFQRLFFIAGAAFVALEVAARKHSDSLPFPVKMGSRIGLVASLALLACRYWGAYSYTKGIQQQINNVANERTEFYGNPQNSSTTQILHPREAEYWVEKLDPKFKEWLDGLAPDTESKNDSEMRAAMEPIFRQPPFNHAILRRCVEPSPIIESYIKIAESVNEFLQYRDNVIQAIKTTHPQLGRASGEIAANCTNIYLEKAYWCLIPKKYQKSINQSGTLVYKYIQEWKQNLVKYREGTTQKIDVSLKIIRPSIERLKGKELLNTGKDINGWAQRASQVMPDSEDYQQCIKALQAKLIEHLKD